MKIKGGIMSSKFSRRKFLRTGIGLGAGAVVLGKNKILMGKNITGRLKVIASANGLKASEKAMQLLRQGKDPLDAVIAGVNLVENDPEDISVGYGGLPNEDGVIELDASVMHGQTHNGGAVASLRNVKNPSKVAKLVMERTDHSLLVGEGALRFAKAHGFREENLLTEKARKIWLERKEKHSDRDFWFPSESERLAPELQAYLNTHGTINCVAIDSKGDLAGVTTTSGYFYKIPGRVGDSPIIGAGLYVDNDVGAAGSTGRGEANILNCGSYLVVNFMSMGFSPEEACLKALKKILQKSKLQPRLFSRNGKPRFSLNFYAINKKGEFGAGSIWRGRKYAIHDGKENKLRPTAYLFETKK